MPRVCWAAQHARKHSERVAQRYIAYRIAEGISERLGRISTRSNHLKQRSAVDTLEVMRLSISDAIRLLMLRVAEERRLPFDIRVPNATTRKATAELESGKGRRVRGVKQLLAELNADD